MLRLRWILVGAAVGLASSAALAFQETKGGGAADPPPAVGVSPTTPGLPQLNLKDTGTSVASPAGVEVRIPGLGKLGVLPKFDFGLELLYGVNEQRTPESERQGHPLSGADEDVQIRGSLKHRF